MRTMVAVICVVTLLAITYLSLSLAIFRPPRANYASWAVQATLFGAQAILTLYALAYDRRALRLAAAAGSSVLLLAGLAAIRATLVDPHFEGYALLLGVIVIVQSILTIAAFVGPAARLQNRSV